MMRIIDQGEERRRQARMEQEARRWTSSQPDEPEQMDTNVDTDEALLEELLRKEEEEVLALLTAKEEFERNMLDMEDVIMSDLEDVWVIPRAAD